MTVQQVSDVTGIGRSTIYRAIKNGKLQALKIGHSIRIPSTALDEFAGLTALPPSGEPPAAATVPTRRAAGSS